MKRRMKRHAVIQPLDPSYRYIALTRNQTTIVDAEDFEALSQFNWYANWGTCTKSFYAARTVRNQAGIRKQLCMQNQIMGGMSDHINHDTLDNRRRNLRRCTHAENTKNQGPRSTNTSGFKGACFHKMTGKWHASIKSVDTRNGKQIYLGVFSTKEDAARAYDSAAKEYHGEFAFLNFPEKQ